MHTGDGGRVDDEGFVDVVDRVNHMIVSGGGNVYSTEVEEDVARHPAEFKTYLRAEMERYKATNVPLGIVVE
jgi:acyl-CoA synthetase (AMP-forming)/AMP-acid ligase II